METESDKMNRNGKTDSLAKSITDELTTFAINHSSAEIPDDSLHVMLLSLFDWVSLGQVGTEETVSRVVLQMINDESGNSEAGVFGQEVHVPARAAALSNGTTTHALDYDDTHFAYVGHPSVVVISATLALAEKIGISGRKFLTDSLIGAEAACRIGSWLGRKHYQTGFHQTATSGCFGATLACCRVLELTESQTKHALGIATTRASGLKSQFGTMGKPYNAGIAASNAVEASILASAGFQSNPDAMECSQGFADTHAGEFCDPNLALEKLGKSFVFEDVQHKFHACCHGLHAAIEAVLKLKSQRDIKSDGVKSVRVVVNPRWLKVCNINAPKTGLEAKFSFKQTVALALEGVDTGSLEAYAKEYCQDRRIELIREKVFVEAEEKLTDTEAFLRIELNSGETIESHHETSDRQSLKNREVKIRKKGATLLGKLKADKLWSDLSVLSQSTDSVRKYNLTAQIR